MQCGKFGVIEGNDGTGKTVQTKLLVERLAREGFSVATYDFPQYGNNVFAETVAAYLRNEFGIATKVHPYPASMLYAADRWKTSERMKQDLNEGKIVVANRFASANIGHQGGKYRMKIRELESVIPRSQGTAMSPEYRKRFEEKNRQDIERAKQEMKEFFNWLREMEFEERGFGTLYPDLTVILNLDPRVAQRLKEQQRNAEGHAKDGHESNLEYLECVSETFKELAGREKGWKLVECGDGQEGILPPEAIHEMVWRHFKELLAA